MLDFPGIRGNTALFPSGAVFGTTYPTMVQSQGWTSRCSARSSAAKSRSLKIIDLVARRNEKLIRPHVGRNLSSIKYTTQHQEDKDLLCACSFKRIISHQEQKVKKQETKLRMKTELHGTYEKLSTHVQFRGILRFQNVRRLGATEKRVDYEYL
jgi:hypothetical protein